MTDADVAIVGGGIIGLATAYQLSVESPNLQIVIFEKEDHLASHQTGHNSGVLHSGIYYRPGSLKAVNCRDGKKEMEKFCAEHDIPFDVCGKVIVAVTDDEIPSLRKIYERGQQNGVRCEIIDVPRLRRLEPHVAGVSAIHVPEAGIVDYKQVCQTLATLVRSRGAHICTGTRVNGISPNSDKVQMETSRGSYTSSVFVNCGGLHSDRIARQSGQDPRAKIVPFRGEYYELKPEAYHLCQNLIYPVPDPSFPFLGVHFTRMIDGSFECGPNAVLALAREGYRKTHVNVTDLCESLSYSGFRKLALKYWRVGAGEVWRSFSKRAFVKALQRLIPEIRSEHLKSAPSGVRAQAVMPDGTMVDDFLILQADRIVNVCNAPSPAATSSLNIGRIVVKKILEQMP